jgi:fatty-acyl-CoA synthase
MKHRDVYRTELTPVSFLERNAYVFPDKTAVIHGSRKYTYRQFQERVNRLASALRKAGLKKNDRVAFICPNTPAMLEAH